MKPVPMNIDGTFKTADQQALFDFMKDRRIPLIIKTTYENNRPAQSVFWPPIMTKRGAAFFIGGKIVKTPVAVRAYVAGMVEFRDVRRQA